ncbi:MAG: L-rhamnose mutarotase [Acidimicrobiales bacterium]
MRDGAVEDRKTLKRAGWVIQLRPGAREQYRRLHENVWLEVRNRMHEAGIERYTIFVRDNLLFSYMEYRGEFDDVQAFIESHDETQRWWKLTEPLQNPLESADPGEWWVRMDEVIDLNTSMESTRTELA